MGYDLIGYRFIPLPYNGGFRHRLLIQDVRPAAPRPIQRCRTYWVHTNSQFTEMPYQCLLFLFTALSTKDVGAIFITEQGDCQTLKSICIVKIQRDEKKKFLPFFASIFLTGYGHYGKLSLVRLVPWCSGSTCGPVKAEIAGSNPVGTAERNKHPLFRGCFAFILFLSTQNYMGSSVQALQSCSKPFTGKCATSSWLEKYFIRSRMQKY